MIRGRGPSIPILRKEFFGTPLTTEGYEKPVIEGIIENDAGNKLVGLSTTMEMTDETDGTEDVVERKYIMIGGVQELWRSSKIYTAAPTGSESPAPGCIVFADRATWDPLAKGSGGAYLVMYLGATSGWGALTGQLD